MNSEVWCTVEDYEDYEVSNRGRVRSWRNTQGNRRDEPIVLALVPNRDGYGQVILCNDDGHYHVLVHVLVLEAFVGPCPEGMEARHWDGNASNNTVGNLLWGTHAENTVDTVRHGTHPMAIEPSDEDVVEIQRRYANGESARSIAKEFPELGKYVV